MYAGRAARTVVIKPTELKCSMLLKFAYFCRYRDADKRIEKRRRKAKKSKADEEEEEKEEKEEEEGEDAYAAAFLQYLAQAISYIYRWNTTAQMDKEAELAVKKAAIRILEMDDRLTQVMKFWNSHKVGTLSLTGMGTI